MKNITEYINESLGTDFINYVNTNKDKIPYDTYAKMFNDDREAIDGKTAFNNIPGAWKDKLNIVLNNYHYKTKIINYMNDKSDNGITFKDLLSNNNIIELAKQNNSFFNIFGNNESKLVNFLYSVYNIEPKTSPNTGKGEVLIQLLLEKSGIWNILSLILIARNP